MDAGETEKKKRNMVVGQSELGHRRDNMDIQSIFDSDGLLNFEHLDAIIEQSLLTNLKVNIEETPILFTENAIHNKDQRMKLTEYMFDKYKIPALFLVKDPVLCTFSCGRSSAVVLDVGHKASIATPVNDGYALLKCIIKHDIGGQHITEDLYKYTVDKKTNQIRPRFSFKKKFVNTDGQEMMQLIDLSSAPEIKNTHPNYYKWSQMEIVREMKEDFLSVSEEYLQQKPNENPRMANYELPDGSQLQLSSFERQVFTEKLFQNQSAQVFSNNVAQGATEEVDGFQGVHQMIVESISKSDIDIRRDLFQNIILSGGTTMCRGFQERV